MQIPDRHAVGTHLARLGGADPNVLDLAPKARREYFALALVLLATSGIAVASMAFAMTDGLRVHVAAAIPIGLFWGGVILVIDRALILSLKPKGGKWRTFWMVLPRVVMAALLGLVISTPLTLRIFADEIQEQMTRDQIATANAAAKELANGDLKHLLELKEAEVKKQEDIRAGDVPYTSPGLAQAQQEHTAAEADYKTKQLAQETAYRKWQCELYGVGCEGATKRRGNGPLARALEKEYRSRMAEAKEAKALVDAKQQALLKAQEQNAAGAQEALEKAKTEAEAQLRMLTPQRDDLRQQLQNLNNSAQQQRQDGLLAQLVALGHLGDSDGLARWAHLLVAALLFMIELLPVAIKTLTLLGPTTLYERADKFDDERILKLAAARTARQHVKQEELDKLAIESERRVAVKVTAKVEEVVTDLAMGAVERWSHQTRQAAIAYIQEAPTMELPQACLQCGQPRVSGHVCPNGGQSGGVPTGGPSGGGRHSGSGLINQPWYPRTAPQQPGPYNLPPDGSGSRGKHVAPSGDATP
ncbi:DUF4407 domain-containing protein [Catellatospora sp. NPDC049111]|uniref:DUF4407 domain-containing protein n=1 Tax=Catellatospora sp. NPDC049111 TaxID=3155271 RepID=UPI0033FB9C96